MSGKIFINYRRGDDPGNTGRLFDQLQDVFPRDRLFMDVDSIPPGRDFVRVLEEQIAQCDVLLAVIGRDWLDARDGQGVRRLDKPDDFVRIEIATALGQDKLVIPVLVDNAWMPQADELPDAIRPLARRNAVRLTHERFKSDTDGLIKAIQQALNDAAALRRPPEEVAHTARARTMHRQDISRAGITKGLILVSLTVAVLTAVVWGGISLLTRFLLPDYSIRTFTGHSKDVTSVAFSPDGRTVLSGSRDSTAKLWDVATGKELLTFAGHDPEYLDRDTRAAFSPDGRTALSGSWDQSLKLWEVATGKELQTFQSYRSPAVFSRDGRTVLSGRDGRGYLSSDLDLWEVATGRRLRSFSSHTRGVTSIAFSPDGRTALSGSYDKTLKLWDAATGKELRTFSGHSDGIMSVAFSPDGRTALSSSNDKTLKLWEVASGKELRTFTENDGVTSVAFPPDGRTLLSAGRFASVVLWEVSTGKKLRTFWFGHGAVAVSPDGRTAVSGADNGTLKLWDLTEPQAAAPQRWAE